MSGTRSFGGYGLRKDEGGDFQSATAAVQRVGWFAYQRLVTLPSGVEAGEMVIPAGIDSREALQDFLDSDALHPYVVFHYAGAFNIQTPMAEGSDASRRSTFAHAWLLLRDPTIDGAFEITAEWAGGNVGGEVRNVPLVHAAARRATSPRLVMRTATYEANTRVDLTSPVVLELDYWNGPILLLSVA